MYRFSVSYHFWGQHPGIQLAVTGLWETGHHPQALGLLGHVTGEVLALHCHRQGLESRACGSHDVERTLSSNLSPDLSILVGKDTPVCCLLVAEIPCRSTAQNPLILLLTEVQSLQHGMQGLSRPEPYVPVPDDPSYFLHSPSTWAKPRGQAPAHVYPFARRAPP